MKRRTAYNPKRRIADFNQDAIELCKRLALAAKYGGNPEHKSRPSDFGLTPPTSPRAGKTLCDKSGDFSSTDARQFLSAGFVKGW
jgi:hypothetical protein